MHFLSCCGETRCVDGWVMEKYQIALARRRDVVLLRPLAAVVPARNFVGRNNRPFRGGCLHLHDFRFCDPVRGSV